MIDQLSSSSLNLSYDAVRNSERLLRGLRLSDRRRDLQQSAGMIEVDIMAEDAMVAEELGT